MESNLTVIFSVLYSIWQREEAVEAVEANQTRIQDPAVVFLAAVFLVYLERLFNAKLRTHPCIVHL
jgi:hypothetical protein